MSTYYSDYSSDMQQELAKHLEPLLYGGVYNYNRLNTNQPLWDTPNLASWLPDVSSYKSNMGDSR